MTSKFHTICENCCSKSCNVSFAFGHFGHRPLQLLLATGQKMWFWGESLFDYRCSLATLSGVDDLGSVEVALGPLLNHSSFHDLGPSDTEEEETQDTVVVVTYLGTQRRRIAVTLTSYQSARSLIGQGTPVHGFILVYDTQRKSSFAIMKVSALVATCLRTWPHSLY